MAGPARNPGFPWTALERPLGVRDRARVARSLSQLLAWQRKLARWPRISAAPDATPFVSLYADGKLRGCQGATQDGPGERLCRAFVHALGDARYGGLAQSERARACAEVAYPLRPARVALRALERRFEIGTHGIAVAAPDRQSALLLPSVATDARADLRGLLAILAHKAGLADAALARAPLYLFEVDAVTARPDRSRADGDAAPADRAARWLAARVDGAGRVAFAVDARSRTTYAHGEFQHGRAAIAIQALDAHGAYPRQVARARRWLAGEIRAALAGRTVEAWPAEVARVAGTLALSSFAGLDVREALRKCADHPDVARDAWHAAQVVAALGADAPPRLWSACTADLDRQAWAPWTAIAARAIGDHATLRRCERVLAKSIRAGAPHAGATDVTRVPEIALTAVVVEALAAPTRPASARARAFLIRTQYHPDRVPAALDPALAVGAFPTSLVLDVLRSDVTAHALLALL